MSTLIHLTGFEQGYLGFSGELFSVVPAVVGTGSQTISTDRPRSGAYCLRLQTGAAGSCYARPHTSAATSNVVVGRGAFRIDALPTDQECSIFQFGHNNGSGYLDITTGGVLVAYCGAGSGQNGPTITANDGTWHLFEYRLTMTGNPWSLAWRIDGVPQNPASNSAAAPTAAVAWFDAMAYGLSDNTAAGLDASFDDMALSLTSGDYPLGDGKVIGYVPTGDGTHSEATGVMSYTTNSFSSSNRVANGGTSYTTIDEIPWNSAATDYLRQTANATSDYSEYTLTTAARGWLVNAVRLVGWGRGATTSGCNWNGKLAISSTESSAASVSFATTGRAPFSAIYMQAPGAVAWSEANLATTRIRLGYSSDANPDPWCDAVMLEVDYRPVRPRQSRRLRAGPRATATGSFT